MIGKLMHKFRKVLSLGARALTASKQEPVNFRARDASPEALLKDAEYAWKVGRSYWDAMTSLNIARDGLRGIEFGPGYNMGTALYLACRGLRMSVADRFLTPWDHSYHGPFYRSFKEYLLEKEPELDPAPLDAVIAASGYPKSVLQSYPLSLEDMSRLDPHLFDITLSNAVFEHLFDVPEAFRQLARVMSPGAYGIHQIDHRDHRDFTKPWEFLLLSEPEFAQMFQSCHGECGNRTPAETMTHLFQISGFDIIRRNENMFAADSYLDGFMPRLEASKDSPFRSFNREHLKCISCQYTIFKKA